MPSGGPWTTRRSSTNYSSESSFTDPLDRKMDDCAAGALPDALTWRSCFRFTRGGQALK